MKAIRANSYGSADVLKYINVEKPIPNSDELLVQVKASSVNPIDWKIRRGDLKVLSGWTCPKKLGCDFAGIVQQVGSEVRDYQVGDEVYGFINPLKGGAYAQYLTVPSKIVALKSPDISFEQAAAIPVAGLAALQSLWDLGKIKPGMKVLINGASGGVGIFAVQISNALYAKVTGVCRQKNSALVKRLGADRVIDYTQQDFTQENIKYDLIFDAVGKRNFSECINNLTNSGVYVTTLPTVGNLIASLTTLILSKRKAKIIAVQSKAQDLRLFNRLIEVGKLEIVIDQVFALSEIANAHQYSETGRAVGKIILSIDEIIS
ncbi:NAD(P)-dependent alcohol dehydrogenase [Coleofasciculus chthonoplastes]|uniref:NAD(P)-dependent alcohol dehydrogenase n=1 Tax=Coleofasciculus chthonoplastes TaxID=64178 RepID=UPI0032F7F141